MDNTQSTQEVKVKPPRMTIEVQFETFDEQISFREYCLKHGHVIGRFTRNAILDTIAREKKAGRYA